MTSPSQTGHAIQQVVFITGGASGIGLATARRLAAQGCSVVLVDRAGDQAVAAAETLGAGHIGLQADVTDLASLEAAADATVRRFGRIDVVVANAGIGSASTVRASSTEQLLRIIDINLSGQIRTVKATLEHVIASRGHIAFTCSAAVLKHTPKSSAYAAAKAGIEAFAGALRLEVLHRGVTVGVVYPGWTDTPMLQGAASRASAGSSLPWPLSISNRVDDVADAYADSILRRARTTYVPKLYRVVHWLRPLYTSAAWDRSQRAVAAENVRRWESELPTPAQAHAQIPGTSTS